MLRRGEECSRVSLVLILYPVSCIPQKAVKRNCKAPDFEGLEIYLSHRFDASGGVVSSNFDKHISELQRNEATIMKQMKLWHEETEAKTKNKNKDKNGPGKGAKEE